MKHDTGRARFSCEATETGSCLHTLTSHQERDPFQARMLVLYGVGI